MPVLCGGFGDSNQTNVRPCGFLFPQAILLMFFSLQEAFGLAAGVKLELVEASKKNWMSTSLNPSLTRCTTTLRYTFSYLHLVEPKCTIYPNAFRMLLSYRAEAG